MSVFRESGLRGFYKGLNVVVPRAVLNGAAVFGSYELAVGVFDAATATDYDLF
jgi:hypothetical protein